MKSLRCLALVFSVLISGTGSAQTPPSWMAQNIYLKCSAPSDPEGVNDVHLDFANRTLTDFFGTKYSFREDAQYIIVETFVEIDGKREVATTRRINRFTLEFVWMWPAQKIFKSGRCVRLENKL